MKALLLSLFVLGFSATASAHPCDSDAREKADALLRFHYDSDGTNLEVEDKVTVRPSLKNPAGPGRFDVLEVVGYVYRATYRMRFIYAQIPGYCALMGQEILELGNPY